MTSYRSLGRLTSRLIHGRRWLGLDRNPLRRTVDRAETAVRLGVAVLILTVVPAMTVLAGRWAYHTALSQVRAQDAATHAVSAVLLDAAPGVGTPDPYEGTAVAWVPARWVAPDGPVRTGDVLAPAGAKRGSLVRTWVDEAGNFVDPPPGRNQVVGNVFMAVLLSGLCGLALVFGGEAVSHQVLERRRMKAWDADWRTVAPRWTGHTT
ncbi:MAG: hypothetical protein JO016_00285 [Actinobacteria bacterium]|nr:hypothetical protein [Actinomycetota bacterium]